MGNKLKKLYCLINIFAWFVILIEFLVIFIYEMVPQINKNAFFFNIVSPCGEFAILLLCLIIPIIIVLCVMLLILSIIQKDTLQLIQVLVISFISFVFVVVFISAFVVVTGGV